VDLDVGAMSRREVVLEDVVELELGYQIIEQAGEARPALIARVRSPDAAGIAIYRVDIEAGRAHRLDATELPPSGQRLRVGHRFAELRRIPIPRVTADWDDDGAAGSFHLDQTRKTITLASGLQVNGHTMTWSPARTRLAFTTMADDPCSGDQSGRMVILYATDAATGKLREVTRGPGPLAPVWLDEQRVAYTDRTERSPAVIIADVLSPETRDRLTTRGGLSTHHLAEEPFCLPDASRDDESR